MASGHISLPQLPLHTNSLCFTQTTETREQLRVALPADMRCTLVNSYCNFTSDKPISGKAFTVLFPLQTYATLLNRCACVYVYTVTLCSVSKLEDGCTKDGKSIRCSRNDYIRRKLGIRGLKIHKGASTMYHYARTQHTHTIESYTTLIPPPMRLT